MRDEFIGDVGDYYKYSLLRGLTGCGGLKLGVVWYYNNDPIKNNHGNHLAFLENEKRREFIGCDLGLYDALLKLYLDWKPCAERVKDSGGPQAGHPHAPHVDRRQGFPLGVRAQKRIGGTRSLLNKSLRLLNRRGLCRDGRDGDHAWPGDGLLHSQHGAGNTSSLLLVAPLFFKGANPKLRPEHSPIRPRRDY